MCVGERVAREQRNLGASAQDAQENMVLCANASHRLMKDVGEERGAVDGIVHWTSVSGKVAVDVAARAYRERAASGKS